MASLLAKFGVQLFIWAVSAGLNLFLLPFICLLWLWTCVTSCTKQFATKRGQGVIDSSRFLREFGTHRYVQLEDVSIHYVEAGDRTRPLMLCLHGFPEFWYSWRYQIKEFSSDYWVVAVDLRGYGLSDKPNGRAAYRMNRLTNDVRGIIEKLGRQKCDVLLSHDWGGTIGWSVCQHFPHLVDRLVVMNCPHPSAYLPVALTEYSQILKSWYMIFFQLPVVPEILLTAFGGTFAQVAFHAHRSTRDPDEAELYLEIYKKPGNLTGPMNYYRNLVEILFHKKPNETRVQVPTLIIWGLNDRSLNRALAAESAKWAENVTVVYIPEASHRVQQDAPGIVNEKIREFLLRKPVPN